MMNHTVCASFVAPLPSTNRTHEIVAGNHNQYLQDFPVDTVMYSSNTRPRSEADTELSDRIIRKLGPTTKQKRESCYLSNITKFSVQSGFRLHESPSSHSVQCYSRETPSTTSWNYIVVMSPENAVDCHLMEPGKHGFTYSTSFLQKVIPPGEPFSLFTVYKSHLIHYHGQYTWVDYHSPLLSSRDDLTSLSSKAWRTLSSRQRQLLIEIDAAERRAGSVSSRAAEDIDVQPILPLYLLECQGYDYEFLQEVRAPGKVGRVPWLKQMRTGVQRVFDKK